MADYPSQLTIRLLGTPLVERGSTFWTLSNQKGQALFFYLAATGQAHTRDHLMALLWGDTAVRNARHSLRSSLHKLRQALRDLGAAEVLIIDKDRLRLDLRRVRCDVARFQQLVATGDEAALSEAAGLVRGLFLQGFSLPDAPLFDEFVQLEETQLSRSYQGALERLAALAEQREDWEQAIGFVQQITLLDPINEQAQQRLMALYVRSGAPGLARRHYAYIERTLRQELGMAPAPQTRETLRLAVEQQRVEQQLAAPNPPPASPITFSLPFVGREGPLARLHDSARLAARGRGTVVLVEGEAGIGKSRLTDELIIALRPFDNQRWIALQGRCSPFDSILAFGAFREALYPLLQDRPDQRERGDPLVAGRDDPFAELVLRTLESISHHQLIALVIDDLHLADQQTITLFGYLAFHLRNLPVLLIGTVQRVADVPALQELTTLGRRRGDLELIALDPLTLGAIQALLAGLGVVPTAIHSLAPGLFARSGGNPFVVNALIAQLQAEAIMVPHDDGWHLNISHWVAWQATTVLPETTHDLVILRLNMLQPIERQVMNVLAVAGNRLAPELIATTIGSDEATIRDSLEALLALRLVVEQSDAIALPHHLLHEAVLRGLSNRARRAIHQRLAIAWEQRRPDGSATGEQIARHAVAAGDVDRARRFGLSMLSDLPYSYVGAQTVTFLRQLYDLVAPTASVAEQRRLAHALGQAYRSLGQIDTASSWHARQLALAAQAQAPDAEAIAHFEIAELAFMRTNYTAAAESSRAGLACAAQAAATPQLALQGRGHRLLGGALAMEGSDLPSAEQHLREAIDAHRQAGDHVNLSVALFELGNVVAQQGVIVRAVDLYREAATMVDAAQTPFLLALAHNNIAYHSLLLGRLEDARAALAVGRGLAEQHALSGALLHLFSTESEIHLYTGDWAAAGAACRHGQALASEFANIERQAGYQAGLALVAASSGLIHEAIEQIEGALESIRGHGFWHLRTRLLLWLAELMLHTDRATMGIYLDTALTLARSQRRRLLLLQGERLQALLLAANGAIAAAQARLVEQLEQAAELGLSLEVARTRAALARVTLSHAPRSASGRALLAEALSGLAAHSAHAEYNALSNLAPPPLLRQ